MEKNGVLNLDKIREEIINSALDKILKDSKSDIERKLKREEILSKLNSNSLITNTKNLSSYIKADELNRLFNELYIDDLTCFKVINFLSETSYNFNTNYRTNLNLVNTKIEKIKLSLKTCRDTLSNMNMLKFHIEEFLTHDSFDKDRRYMKDRYGHFLPSKCYVENDNYFGITLPYTRRDNTLKYDNKVQTGKISINFELGTGFLTNQDKNSNLNNVVNDDKITYFNQNIVSDAPFEVSFANRPIQLHVNDGYYYGITNGLVSEIEINFESVNTINEINLTPFVKYPINVVAIRYKLTDDQEEELSEIVYPNNENKTLRSVFTTKNLVYKFPDILCKRIYIVINQKHYDRETFVYNPNLIYKNTNWFNSKNKLKNKNINAEFKGLYNDRNHNILWKNINDRIIENNDNDLSKVLINNEKITRKLIKYSYQYGFYNIGLFNNHYDRIGIYISKPLKLDESVKSVSINTDEIHSKNILDNYVTDIEYYISINELNEVSDWISIIPKNKEIIESELLFISENTRAFFRFPAKEVLSIMKNGESIDNNINEYNIEKDDRTNLFTSVQIFNYDFDAVYSVKYKPSDGYNEIDLIDKVIASIETFEANFNNSFLLSNNILLNKDNDYISIKIMDMRLNSSIKEEEAINVTDLTDTNNSYMNFKDNSKFEYYINNNIVYFNKPIEKGCMVEISYKHLISKLRLKAILRRNTIKDGWLTPSLKRIEYNIETI